MRIAIVYYSRTGNTAYVVEILRRILADIGIAVDLYKALPVNEYAKPLHANPRLIHDTLVRKGTDIKLEPKEPKFEDYDAVIVASPIWYSALAPPVQEFLKRFAARKTLIVVTTSTLTVDCAKIERAVEELCGFKPSLCINITINVIRDSAKLKQLVQSFIKELLSTAKRG